jgi:putative exosortase-associated protein (TIGR04073 family)
MRKIALCLCLILLLSATSAGATLEREMDSGKALTKFGRGVTNIATSPGEFVNQIPAAMEQSPDYFTGFITLLGRGLGYMCLRAGAGIYDLATFPFPGKTNYGSIIKPETIVNPVADTTIS